MSTEYRREGASGTGLATVTTDGTVLDVWYPAPVLAGGASDDAVDLAPLVGTDELRGVRTEVVRTEIASLADAPAAAADVYLRLHTCSATASSSRTRSTSRASSGCSPTSSGPTTARARCPGSSSPGRSCAAAAR